jgi:two-component system sensor histidine kinase KdpD
MVCLSLDPASSQELLRKGARAASRLNADWYAVHVDTPAESLKKINTKDFRALLDNINLAGDLGAEVVWLEGEDAVKVLLEFAYEKHILRIIVGRAKPTFWNRLFRRSVTDRMVAAARDFEVDIVNLQPRNK